MKWNKLEARELTKEEQEIYTYDSIWDGCMPELDEQVLVTVPSCNGGFVDTYTDIWTDFNGEVGFENTDNDIIYWMEMPKYNGELENE
ncbi:hypothetical protein O3800_01760 [Gemella sanguinis]|jgi:hypothetical protein|uniref:hypothetical protein n=1 Tax=Gemella sanguinis TaxID=84135 RepID=UPI00352CE8CC